MGFTKFSIYAAAHIDTLRGFFEGGGTGEIVENSKWAGGSRIFHDAQKSGQRVPVIFADSSKDSTGELLYWGLLTDVEVLSERSTRFRFEGMTPLGGAIPKSKLILRDGNKPLADTYQRSYSIIYTPSFILHS